VCCVTIIFSDDFVLDHFEADKRLSSIKPVSGMLVVAVGDFIFTRY